MVWSRMIVHLTIKSPHATIPSDKTTVTKKIITFVSRNFNYIFLSLREQKMGHSYKQLAVNKPVLPMLQHCAEENG